MPLDEFFALNKENLYNTLRRTTILPDDNPLKISAMKIMEALEQGKEAYLKDHRGNETVNW